MIILNTRINRKVQKYVNGITKETSSTIQILNDNFRGKLYDYVKQEFDNNYYTNYVKTWTFSHIYTKSIDIPRSRPVRLLVNQYKKYIKKITWDVDESLIDYIEIIIGGSTIDICYQPYFKILRKLYNLDFNELPLYIISNGLICTNYHEQILYIYFKNTIKLPHEITINTHFYDNFTNTSPSIIYPIQQTLHCKSNFGKHLLDKILIPQNIENIIFEINTELKIPLKRIDYYDNKSIFSMSDFYQNNDILNYGLELSKINSANEFFNMRHLIFRNKKTDKIINIDICFIVTNTFMIHNELGGLMFNGF
jgi:hypothetical protein